MLFCVSSSSKWIASCVINLYSRRLAAIRRVFLSINKPHNFSEQYASERAPHQNVNSSVRHSQSSSRFRIIESAPKRPGDAQWGACAKPDPLQDWLEATVPEGVQSHFSIWRKEEAEPRGEIRFDKSFSISAVIKMECDLS
jgi:hypothetical protein